MSRQLRPLTIVLLAAVLAVSACGNSDKSASPSGPPSSAPATEKGTAKAVPITGVPGVTDASISYTVIGTKANNPLGTCILDCYRDGIDAYFAYRNSTGGVYGRKLVTTELDDEVGKNQVRALEVIANKKSFGTFNATLVPSGWADLNKAGIPDYVLGQNPATSAGLEANFPSLPVACVTCPQRVWAYAAEVAKATKIATIGYGVSDVAKQCVTDMSDTMKRYGSAFGAKVVYFKDDLPFGLSNGVGPEVAAMKRAGVDFIASCMDLNGNKTVAQELRRQGMDKVVIFHQNLYDQKFVTDAADLFEGDIVRVYFRPFEAKADGTALADFRTWMKKTGSALSENAMSGWINADLAYRGLLAAGPKFDQASVIAATNSITDWDAGGLLVPIDWTKAHNVPAEGDSCGTLVRIVHGKFQTVAPADKPWLCWSGPDDKWSEPQATATPR